MRIALLGLNACGSSEAATAPIANPGFEAKPCDEGSLCDWIVVGQVESVPTWHPEDRGSELIGAPVSISQLIDPWDGGPCVTFELIADVAAAASVLIELDFGDDGNIDYTDPIPAAHWTLLTYQHSVPQPAQRLRVSIRKQSAGRAVLARLDLSAGACGP